MDLRLPSFVACLVLGIGSAGGEEDLADDEVHEIERIAGGIHRRSRWACPPDPMRLAALEGVELTAIETDGIDPMFCSARAFYPPLENERERGLWQAYTLAGAILLRRQARISSARLWCLAAELLVPAWAVDEMGVERLCAAHRAAPHWLVVLRAKTRHKVKLQA